MMTIDRRATRLTWKRCVLPETIPDRRELYFWMKRLTDLVLALTLLIVLSPLLLLIAMLTKVDSSGPALFSQERMGFDWRKCKRFSCF